MIIRDLLLRDPITHPLANSGQARIVDAPTDQSVEEIRRELATFVCEGRYADGIERILDSFLGNLGNTNQKAAWVSGFFGSGKSHLLKMVAHLWNNTTFPDGAGARSLVSDLPTDIAAKLRELDNRGKRAGGVLAAAGALPSGNTDNVRLTVLSIILRAVGLPGHVAQAKFCLWLREQGYYERVTTAVERAGKGWDAELNNLYVSRVFAPALLECDPQFATSEANAKEALRAQFPTPKSDITTHEFTQLAHQALKWFGKNGEIPCTLIVLDEMQQYVGGSNDRSVYVTETAEALSKEMESRVMVVGAGQSALTDVLLLHKLMDRFTIRVPLSDIDVETVTRKVLLQKKPTANALIRKTLDAHAGEIARQLHGTRIAARAEDEDIIIDDYPLLPVRRRFWEHCFRQADPAGTHSQLRSQLGIIHDALCKVADRAVGVLIPADDLYAMLAPAMVVSGVLPREIDERVSALGRNGSAAGILARRVCALAFLIGRLPRAGGADIGVRATSEHIADLIIDDLTADNGKLRSAVAEVLEQLTRDGVLMQVGDEYRLQTTEGTDWDREFRNRQTKLANDVADVHDRQERLLYAAVNEAVRSLKITQGAAKESRSLALHHDDSPPPVTGESIPIWVRDGWSASEKEHIETARRSGSDSPILFVFVSKQHADDLRKLVVEADAAQQTLDAKGIPASPEGMDARKGMESRMALAVRQRNELIKRIVTAAKVFQGGGSEMLQLELIDRLREAADAACVRLFPQFKQADAPSSAWEAVIKRARDGADSPLQPVGHAGPTEQHPVCQQVLATVGSGKIGGDVRKTLEASPFGWPRDAIDAALIALHRTQHLSAMLNAAAIPLGQLDHARIAKAEFRVERGVLAVQERIRLRGLFAKVGVPCKNGEETTKSPEFLLTLAALGEQAGGEPPLPTSPSMKELDDYKRLVGNAQLTAILSHSESLGTSIDEWKKRKELAELRLPTWRLAERLAVQAKGLPSARDLIAELDAVRAERLLLQPTDPVSPLRVRLASALRTTVMELYSEHARAHTDAVQRLDESTLWTKLPNADRARIMRDVGLAVPVAPATSDDTLLAEALESQSLAARTAEVDAIGGRMQRALELAARQLEPLVRPWPLERATLRNANEIHEWLARQEQRLIAAVKDGPILVS